MKNGFRQDKTDSGSSWKRGGQLRFLKALFTAALVIGAAFLNPLNVITASGQASQDVFFRFMAPFYGEEHQRDEDHKPITVIILDDEYLKRQELSWPVPYRVMTKMLKALYCFEPKGIFIDLLYTHNHSRSDKELDRFIDYLKPDSETTARIKSSCAKFLDDEAFENRELAQVFVGDQAPLKNYLVPNGSVVLDTVRKAGVRRLPTNFVEDHGIYPLILQLDACTSVERIVHVGDGSCGKLTPYQTGGDLAREKENWDTLWPGHIDGEILSPALALYNVLDEEDNDVRGRLDDEPSEMVVSWGFYPRHLSGEAMTDEEHRDENRLKLRRFHADCNVRPASKYAPYFDGLWELLQDLVGRFDKNPDMSSQICPYSQWIPAEAVHLVRGDAKKETLRRLFKDRIVMIGADIRGAPDLMQSPVHGQIPGVFYHAMALDNLLEYGPENQWRPLSEAYDEVLGPNDFRFSLIPAGGYIEAVLVVLFFLISAHVEARRASQGDKVSALVAHIIEYALHLLLIVLVMIIMALMHFAPFNWLALLGLVTVMGFLKGLVTTPNDIEKAVKLPLSANAKENFPCSEPSASRLSLFMFPLRLLPRMRR
ncbi:MAG: CHASE2 domain-containing protein [Geminicoccaceae bacterium]